MIDTLALLDVIQIVGDGAADLGLQAVGGDVRPEMAHAQLGIALGEGSGLVDLLAHLQVDGLKYIANIDYN